MVRPDMEPGALPAGQRKVMAARPAQHRNNPSYRDQGYGGHGRTCGACLKGCHTGETDRSGESASQLMECVFAVLTGSNRRSVSVWQMKNIRSKEKLR